MYQRIVVPLDGSKRAERAIPPAALLARRSHGSLTFMRVVLPPVDTGKYMARQADMLQRRAFEKEKGEAASYLAKGCTFPPGQAQGPIHLSPTSRCFACRFSLVCTNVGPP